MKRQQYRPGDRVITCEQVRDLPVGIRGVIRRVYVSMPGTYDVHFDQRADIYTVWGGHLEPAPAEAAVGEP